MPARLRKTHQADVRAKIQTSQLINRLQDHALGKLELETSQIKSIEVLIRKTLPDLSAIQLSGDPDGAPIEYRDAALAEVEDIFGTPDLIVEPKYG